MSNNWQQQLCELKKLIAKTPDIKISKKTVAIPDTVRGEFYRLFDNIRGNYLIENFPNLLEESITLSGNYIKVENEVTQLLNLKGIQLPIRLDWYLHNPINGLTRSLFEPLHNLIKEEIDVEGFCILASENILSDFMELFYLGYEKWLLLSLLKLLSPNKLFHVDINNLEASAPPIAADVGLATREDLVSDAIEVSMLSLNHGTKRDTAFIVPDLIVRLDDMNRYVAIRTQCKHAVWIAKIRNDKREWIDISLLPQERHMEMQWPSLLIYVEEEIKNIGLVADQIRIARPDLIVECMDQMHWFQKEGFKVAKHHQNMLNPKYGTYIVSRWPMPEQELNDLFSIEAPSKDSMPELDKKQEVYIHILDVGFNQSNLEPIIKAIISSDVKTTTGIVVE